MSALSRDLQLDVVRCVAVFLIVLLHAWGAASQYADPTSWEYRGWTFLAARVTGCAMPALFLVSGYLLFKEFSIASWPQKMLRRIRRLGVPYVCWNVVFVLFYLAACRFFPRVEARVEAFGLMTGVGCLAKVLHPFVTPIDIPVWFMRTIFVFALAAPVLWGFLGNRYGRWVGFTVAVGYFVSCEFFHRPWELPGYPAYALLVFYIGGLLAVSGRAPCGFFRCVWWLLPGAVGLALGAMELLGWCDPLGLVSRELLLAPVLFYFVSRIPRPASFIPHPSYLFFLYCGHFLFCSVWVHALAPRMDVSVPGSLTLLIGLFLIPGLVSLTLSWSLLHRYLRSFLRLFDGCL